MLKRIIFFFLVFNINSLFSQIRIYPDSLHTESGYEITDWKYKNGDDLKWGTADLNDSSWNKLIPEKFDSLISGNAWFRCSIVIDSTLNNLSLGFIVLQTGASEIYFDGQLVKKFGVVSTKEDEEERFNTNGIPIAFNYSNSKTHQIAVRYSNHDQEHSYNSNGKNSRNFSLKIIDINTISEALMFNQMLMQGVSALLATFFISLALLHLLLFLFYKKKKSNLYYFIFAFILGMFPASIYINSITSSFIISGIFNSLMIILFPMLFISLVALLNSIFYETFPKRFKIQFIITCLFSVYFFFQLYVADFLLFSLMIYFSIAILKMVYLANRKKKRGAKIIGAGVLCFIGFVILGVLIISYALISRQSIILSNTWAGVFILTTFFIAIISIPVSMSIFLASDFATTSKSLSRKLIEVKELSDKNIEQEKEKQKILEGQKEILEIQVKERTQEIVDQKILIEEKNKDITDSISYAKTIQEAILPDKEIKYRLFPQAFVLFKPKDIVSGDFYWFTEKNGKKIIAACDCTGHGVPGALMSMIGNNILHQIVNENGITSPANILDNLNKGVKKALKQGNESKTQDGMDVAMLSFQSELLVEYAGAQRPLWIVRNNEIIEIKGDKFPIGGFTNDNEGAFMNHLVTLEKNDSLYIFSDGYADQFSKTNKKLMTKRFKQLLLEIQSLSMAEQEKHLDLFIEEWKGSFEQTDDILVIGIKA